MSCKMRVEKTRLRYMTEKDLPAVLQMASEEGWISNLSEFQMFMDLNPFGCFVCVSKSKVIGSIMTFFYEKSAWIGNFLVSKEYRSKGIGKCLFRQVIDYLELRKREQIFLNSSTQGKKLYEKFGFNEIIKVDRWQGKIENNGYLFKKDPKTFPDIIEALKIDIGLWNDYRFELMSYLSNSRNLKLSYNLEGFIMYGKIGKVVTIGPWELNSKSKKIAEQLFCVCLSEIESSYEIFLDVPEVNIIAKEILEKYGFKKVGSTFFMSRGENPKIKFKNIFSFATMGSVG